MESTAQTGILAAVPSAARFVTFRLAAPALHDVAWRVLSELRLDRNTVLGFGAPLLSERGAARLALTPFPTGIQGCPSTQGALWIRLAHPDAGDRFDTGRRLAKAFAPALVVVEETEAFFYRDGRDLSGFVDGTENPTGGAAQSAALAAGRGAGIDGGSFVAVQRWVHDLDAMERMTPAARNAMVGRTQDTNVELPDAPADAHVKRTAQESFDPPAFMVRRSMPYGGTREHGLYFVAFVESLPRFERMLRRMAGADDGIVDRLFSVSRPVTGGYYFCPPLLNTNTAEARLDLSGVTPG